MVEWTRARKAFTLLFAGGLVLATAFAAWHVTRRLQLDQIRPTVSERLNLYEATIRQTIDRFSYLPQVLSLDPRIASLLSAPTDAAKVAEVNLLLESITVKAGAAALYVLDTKGLTLAASNWNQRLSFVGNNYSFRPYFTGALKRGAGHFYGVGVTTGEPGFFISARIGPADAPIGVATVKISLGALEQEWRAANEAVLLADEKGVIFLSSRPSWVYRPLAPLRRRALEHALATHQYGNADLTSRPLTAAGSKPEEGTVEVHEGGGRKAYLIVQRPLGEYDWTIAVLQGFDEVDRTSWQAAALAGLALSVVFLVGIILAQRRATIRTKLRAHDELERRVQARTRELVLTNERLASEVEQRIRAEDHLRQTQDELVQAGKLAALGHMSAALSHEISQPLAALRTYASSTLRLAGQGNLEAVRGNMGRIEHLLARMSDISSHLKRFARAEAGPAGTVEIDTVLMDALALIAARVEAEDVKILRLGEAGLAVHGSENRLEQVFVNLFTNALDAMRDSPRRQIAIRVTSRRSAVSVEVEDTGPGVPDDNHGLIFAPYFTTKEVGSGLGLGLSISHTIVTSFGGSLTVRNAPGKGAVFVVRLRAAKIPATLEAAE